MPFPASVVDELLVKCARFCCLCRQHKGQKMEIHHIDQEADGGANTADNGLPVCFDCHADVNSYNDNHPKGRKYRAKELRQLRDQWFKLVAEGKTGGQQPVVLTWNAPAPPAPLSQEAEELLTKAALVPGVHAGVISVVDNVLNEVLSISPGHREKLYSSDDARAAQRYKSALEELESRNLVSRSGIVRNLTSAGFALADELLKRS